MNGNQISKNKAPTKFITDTSREKQYKTITPESIHLSNTNTEHLIFTAIEKRDTSTLTKKVGPLSLQSEEKRMSDSYMNIKKTRYQEIP